MAVEIELVFNEKRSFEMEVYAECGLIIGLLNII